MNLFRVLTAQMRFSRNAFGENRTAEGLLKHIRLEIDEIEKAPQDPSEYADAILLLCDLSWRQGIRPYDLCRAIEEKQAINFQRKWNVPADPAEPIAHIKENPAEADLRARALKAMEWINTQDLDLFVSDSSDDPALKPDQRYFGGTYRLCAKGTPFICWYQSASDLINQAELFKVWKDHDPEPVEPEITDPEALAKWRDLTLRAAEYLRRNADKTVIDVSDHPNAPKHLGGTFRVWSNELPAAASLMCAGAVIVLARMYGFRFTEEYAPFDVSPEVEDLIELRYVR